MNFGFRPGYPPDTHEVLGPWFTQVALGLGILFFVGTTVAMRALLRRFRHWRKGAMHPGETRHTSAATAS